MTSPRYVFKARLGDEDLYEYVDYECELEQRQCIAENANGLQCARLTHRLPYCTHHQKQINKVVVRPSTVTGAGMGLFACDETKTQSAVIFRKGDFIAEYGGEEISDSELHQRYSRLAAPYAWGPRANGMHVDGSCVRFTAAFANDARTRAGNNCVIAEFRIPVVMLPSLNQSRFVPYTSTVPIVGLIATKNISNNREIFCDYGGEYWAVQDDVETNATIGIEADQPCEPFQTGRAPRRRVSPDRSPPRMGQVGSPSRVRSPRRASSPSHKGRRVKERRREITPIPPNADIISLLSSDDELPPTWFGDV
jgi:hypothetical protein